jgi:uncharacterized protein YndB with AHSA1/START domain
MTEETPGAAPSFRAPLFERGDGRVTARFSLAVGNAPDEVWAALTEPARFVYWLAPGEIDPRPGGAVKLAFEDSGLVIDSRVSAFEPMRVLEYSWSGPGEPERPVRFELAPAAAGTGLELTVSVPPGEDVGRAAAGWAAHLEMLTAALAGAPIKFPFEVYKAAREAYRTRLAADQA